MSWYLVWIMFSYDGIVMNYNPIATEAACKAVIAGLRFTGTAPPYGSSAAVYCIQKLTGQPKWDRWPEQVTP